MRDPIPAILSALDEIKKSLGGNMINPKADPDVPRNQYPCSNCDDGRISALEAGCSCGCHVWRARCADLHARLVAVANLDEAAHVIVRAMLFEAEECEVCEEAHDCGDCGGTGTFES